MTSLPPLLPEEVLTRVFRLARLDGLSVLLVATTFAIIAALARDVTGAMAGLLVAGAGASELHGTSMLRVGDARGMSWLVGSQLCLLVSILAYVGVRLSLFELPPVPEDMKKFVEFSASQVGMTGDQYLRFVHRVALWIVAGLSILYQGGMAWYYLRHRAAVARALETAELEPEVAE
jgi:hypothetical protein